jgi:hypothetical protein
MMNIKIRNTLGEITWVYSKLNLAAIMSIVLISQVLVQGIRIGILTSIFFAIVMFILQIVFFAND